VAFVLSCEARLEKRRSEMQRGIEMRTAALSSMQAEAQTGKVGGCWDSDMAKRQAEGKKPNQEKCTQEAKAPGSVLVPSSKARSP